VFAALSFASASAASVVPWQTKVQHLTVLLQIVVAASWIRVAPQLVAPGVIGIDPWFHLGFIERIESSGFVPANTSYSGLAQLHLYGVAFATMIGLANLASLEILGPIFSSISLLFTYLLARHLFGPRVAVLSAAAFGFAVDVIAIGFSLLASTLAVTLALGASFLYLKFRGRPAASSLGALIVLMLALIYTHTVIALTFLTFLVVARIVEVVGPTIGFVAKDTGGARSSLLWAFFGVSMLGWWAYVSGHLTDLAELVRWSFQYEPWTQSGASLSYLAQVGNLEYALNNLGLLGFVAVSLLGTLVLFSSPRNWETSGLLGTAWVFGVIGLGSILLGLSGLLGYRWILSFEIFASPMVGVGLFWIVRSIRSPRVAALVVGSLVGLVAFASITSPLANYDTNVYSAHTFPRLEFTISELTSLGTLGSKAHTAVLTLYPEFYYFGYYRGEPVLDVGPYLVNHNLSGIPPGLVVLRTSSSNSPIYFTRTLIELPYDPVAMLSSLDSKVYDSGSVVAFDSIGSP